MLFARGGPIPRNAFRKLTSPSDAQHPAACLCLLSDGEHRAPHTGLSGTDCCGPGLACPRSDPAPLPASASGAAIHSPGLRPLTAFSPSIPLFPPAHRFQSTNTVSSISPEYPSVITSPGLHRHQPGHRAFSPAHDASVFHAVLSAPPTPAVGIWLSQLGRQQTALEAHTALQTGLHPRGIAGIGARDRFVGTRPALCPVPRLAALLVSTQ